MAGSQEKLAASLEVLEARFGSDWSLSPDRSLLLQVGDWAVPRQLLVRSPKVGNKITMLAHDASIVETHAALPGNGQAVAEAEAVAEGVKVKGAACPAASGCRGGA